MYLEEIFGLKGKVAIVTGGRRGIGQVVACGLAKAGAEVVILSRTLSPETVKMITDEGGKAYDVVADVTDEKAVDEAIAEIMRRSGHIDVLFNNAGICIHEDTLKATIDEWRQVIDTNLTGEYIVARAVGRVMIENHIKGSIINMGSMSGTIVNIPQWQASYNASKAGVIHITKSLAIESAPPCRQIRPRSSKTPGCPSFPSTAWAIPRSSYRPSFTWLAMRRAILQVQT